jgi:hypothetical protein
VEKHWLTRPRTIRRLWIVFVAILAATLLAEIGMPVEGHFGIDASPGFNAWYGFAACAAMIIAAKVLGWALKRGDRYYEGDGEDER